MHVSPMVLFTGFGPFRDHRRNASWDAARAARNAFGPAAGSRLLDVTFDGVADAAREDLAGRLVVAMGITPGDLVRVESVGRNSAAGEPDASGAAPLGPLDPDGPDLRRTDVPVSGFTEALRSVCPVEVVESDDAGGYVCNAWLYHLLAAGEVDGAPAVFVHIPQVDEPLAARIGAAVAYAARWWIDASDA